MSLRLRAAGVFLPPFLKNKYFQRLFRITAEAFDIPMSALDKRSYEAGLRLFTSFTRENALKAIAAGEAGAVGERLFRNALGFGEELRRSLGVRTPADVMAAARVLYRAIGIDLQGAPDGAIVVRSCRFAPDYTPAVCELIASLDRGILTGLAGGGELRFSRRLTEGHDSCRAVLGRESGPG
jgi:hypothetical protein